jgi:hypothetical protein
MPVEIKEIVIRATVSDPKEGQGAAAQGNSGSAAAATIQESIEQVFQIIQDKKER